MENIIHKEKKMNNNTKTQNEDEVSLLDLFTVLLRYRKLIIGITLAFIILAIIGFFIYPTYKYNKSQKENIAQGLFQLEIVPKAQPYVSQGLENFILRPELLTDSLYESGMEEFEFKGGKVSMTIENKATVMYLINLYWIQNLDLSGNIFLERGKEHKMIFRVRRTGSVIEVTFKNKDPKIIMKFLESIYKLSTINVEENLRIYAKMMVTNYERLSSLTKISESVQLILEKDFDTYIFLKDFLDGKEVVVKRVSEPVITENYYSLSFNKRQYFKIGIIIIFAGFFLSVMYAFALNIIHNIKSDEESMKKIRDAMENPAGKKG